MRSPRTTNPTFVNNQTARPIRAAGCGARGNVFRRRPAGQVEWTVAGNNNHFPKLAEGEGAIVARQRFIDWMGPFQVDLTDNLVLRAYDAFSHMSEEDLADIGNNVQAEIARITGQSIPSPGECSAPNRMIGEVCFGPCLTPGEERDDRGICGPPASHPTCPTMQHMEGGKCVCDTGVEMVNGECPNPCPSGQTMDSNGLCACQSPNETINGACVPPCATGQHRGTGTACVCDDPNEIVNDQVSCVKSGGRWENNQCTPAPTSAAPITAEQLAAEKRSSMIKGAAAGAGVVGLVALIYKFLL